MRQACRRLGRAELGCKSSRQPLSLSGFLGRHSRRPRSSLTGTRGTAGTDSRRTPTATTSRCDTAAHAESAASDLPGIAPPPLVSTDTPNDTHHRVVRRPFSPTGSRMACTATPAAVLVQIASCSPLAVTAATAVRPAVRSERGFGVSRRQAPHHPRRTDAGNVRGRSGECAFDAHSGVFSVQHAQCALGHGGTAPNGAVVGTDAPDLKV